MGGGAGEIGVRREQDQGAGTEGRGPERPKSLEGKGRWRGDHKWGLWGLVFMVGGWVGPGLGVDRVSLRQTWPHASPSPLVPSTPRAAAGLC